MRAEILLAFLYVTKSKCGHSYEPLPAVFAGHFLSRNLVLYFHAPVVQWIGHLPPKEKMQVRFLPRAPCKQVFYCYTIRMLNKTLHILLRFNTILAVLFAIVIVLIVSGGTGDGAMGGFFPFIYLFLPLSVVFLLSLLVSTVLFFITPFSPDGKPLPIWKGVLLCIATCGLIAIALMILSFL